MDLDHVRDQVVGLAQDKILHVGRTEAPINPRKSNPDHGRSRLWQLTDRPNGFQILLGAKNVNGRVVGRPLAWTDPDKNLYPLQLESFGSAVKVLYGVADVHLYGQRQLLSRQNHRLVKFSKTRGRELTNQQDKAQSAVMRLKYTATREDLQNFLNSQEVKEAYSETGATATPLQIPESDHWKLTLDHDLSDFQGFLIVGCFEDVTICQKEPL